MSVDAEARAAATAILADAWTRPAFAHALSFCAGFQGPACLVAAMERGYRPAVRRDLMGDGGADAFIAAWNAAAEALGVPGRAHVCMPKGHDGTTPDAHAR